MAWKLGIEFVLPDGSFDCKGQLAGQTTSTMRLPAPIVDKCFREAEGRDRVTCEYILTDRRVLLPVAQNATGMR